MRTVKLIDTTLRDGSHAMNYQYTPEHVYNICKALDEAGVYAVDVGHGAGVGGSVLQYGLSKHSAEELLSAAAEALKNAKLCVLLVPGLGTMEDLKVAYKHGARMVRVAVHCTEVDVGAQHIRLGKELGMEVAAFHMMTHMTTPEALAEQAEMAASYGADIIYIADSSGAMLPYDIEARVRAVQRAVPHLPIGVHCHNNLGLGIANPLAAVDAGAEFVDGALEGWGAGCGNTSTQNIAAVLEKAGITTGADWYKLAEAGQKYVRPLINRPLEVTNEALVLGMTGIYSSFYQRVLAASEKSGVPARAIFEELGKRKVVGGQEDVILDVVLELQEKAKQQ